MELLENPHEGDTTARPAPAEKPYASDDPHGLPPEAHIDRPWPLARQDQARAAETDDPVLRGHMPELRANVWDRYPGSYNPPDSTEERDIGDRQAPFEDPSAWIGQINPDPNRLDRQTNCADCTRSVERNWRGDSQVSAGLNEAGENNRRTEDWSGERFRQMSFDEIANRLGAGGPGSSAMIGVDWNTGGGHYFNAVNYQGRILALDGQTGSVEPWPPSVNGLGYDESMVGFSEAIVRDANGRVI